jgi:hypothetical protein
MGMKSCNNHPTRTAVMHCSQCHKPICDKCVVNGRFCSNDCDGKFSKFYSKYQGGAQRTSPLVRFLQSIVGLAILGGGVYFILRHIGVLK